MSTRESAHCLLVTYLSLTRLTERTTGSSRRLALFADAIRASGASLRVCCAITAEEAQPSIRAACENIEDEIRRAWKIDAAVVASVTGGPSTTPWIAQQTAAMFGYHLTSSIRSGVTPESRSLIAAELARHPAFVVAHRLPAMYAVSAVNRFGESSPPIIFDLDDVEHVVALRSATRAASFRERFFELAALPSLFLAERRGVRRATRTLVCSVEDAARVRRLTGTNTVDVVPNALPLPPRTPALATTPTMLMVGAYGYGPNADGAEFFISKVFPLIRQRIPDAEVTFVGATPERIAFFNQTLAGVRFLGFVDDLDAAYAAARVVICPIRYGGGTRLKLVEAAGWGKPIVSTRMGAEGLGFVSDVHAAFGDSAEEFASACCSLLVDSSRCERLGRAARLFAEEHFDASKISEQLGGEFRHYVDRAREAGGGRREAGGGNFVN